MPTGTEDGLVQGALGAYLACYWIAALIVWVLVIAGYWKMFSKAGEAGWQSIIPIWNLLVLLRIVGRPWWWILLYLIPFVNIIIWVIVSYDTAKSYGHGWGYAIGIILIPYVFYVLLGFGDSQYVGKGAQL